MTILEMWADRVRRLREDSWKRRIDWAHSGYLSHCMHTSCMVIERSRRFTVRGTAGRDFMKRPFPRVL